MIINLVSYISDISYLYLPVTPGNTVRFRCKGAIFLSLFLCLIEFQSLCSLYYLCKHAVQLLLPPPIIGKCQVSHSLLPCNCALIEGRGDGNLRIYHISPILSNLGEFPPQREYLTVKAGVEYCHRQSQIYVLYDSWQTILLCARSSSIQ